MSGPIMTLREIMEAEDPLDIDITEDMEREFSPQRKDTSMREYANQTVGQAGVMKSTPMNSLHSAVSQLREACSDLAELAVQFCGSAPSEIKGSPERDSSGSHFGQIEDCARAVSDLVASINDDLKRIRARL